MNMNFPFDIYYRTHPTVATCNQLMINLSLKAHDLQLTTTGYCMQYARMCLWLN